MGWQAAQAAPHAALFIWVGITILHRGIDCQNLSDGGVRPGFAVIEAGQGAAGRALPQRCSHPVGVHGVNSSLVYF
ncbi:hypothetical protein BA896_002685 [Janthinobacterium lividum]|uniref:Uncharacterized protein n=1 Tax=Janthinobacterium lividum TaxID=29581 RepID=A0A1E8PPX0_9BURK|nr:hypothetical protein BA896_002685 [Janthinobacterium lividum]